MKGPNHKNIIDEIQKNKIPNNRIPKNKIPNDIISIIVKLEHKHRNKRIIFKYKKYFKMPDLILHRSNTFDAEKIYNYRVWIVSENDGKWDCPHINTFDKYYGWTNTQYFLPKNY